MFSSGYLLSDILKGSHRKIVCFDTLKQKYLTRKNSSFTLVDDHLTLRFNRDGEYVSQDYHLLDEPDGIQFVVDNKFIVKIDIKKLNNNKSIFRFLPLHAFKKEKQV